MIDTEEDMPNGGTHHCYGCEHYVEHNSYCRLRNANIINDYYTTCRNRTAWYDRDSTPKEITGPLYSIVGIVRGSTLGYCDLPYFEGQRVDTCQKGHADTTLTFFDKAGRYYECEDIEQYLDFYRRCEEFGDDLEEYKEQWRLEHHRSVLLKDVEKEFPSETVDRKVTMRMCAIQRSTAPIIWIGRSHALKEAIVPVYFISGRQPASELGRDNALDLFSVPDGLVRLFYTMPGPLTGSFYMVPFLYNMFQSAQAFKDAMESFLKRHEHAYGLCWLVEYCYVSIFHEGKNFEPDDFPAVLNG
jgi:hypothetical protein